MGLDQVKCSQLLQRVSWGFFPRINASRLLQDFEINKFYENVTFNNFFDSVLIDFMKDHIFRGLYSTMPEGLLLCWEFSYSYKYPSALSGTHAEYFDVELSFPVLLLKYVI